MSDPIGDDMRAIRRATALLEGEPEDPADTFAAALHVAFALARRDAELVGAARKRHRSAVLLRATQGDLASAMVFARWTL